MLANTSLKIFLFLFLLISFRASSQKKNASIRIQQDESVLLDSFETRLVLQKKAFKIQVLLENMDGIYCYAAFTDSIYRLAETDVVPGFAGLPNLAMAEEQFNKEKELLVNPQGWAYWFYNPKENWHRFNKKIILLDSNRVVGIKSIKQIYFVETSKEVKLKDISQPLYLFFVAVKETDATGKPITELLRKKVKIEWIKED